MPNESRLSVPVHLESNAAERVAFDLTLFMLDAPPGRQDEILTLFTRCLMTIQDPQRGLDEIKRIVVSNRRA